MKQHYVCFVSAILQIFIATIKQTPPLWFNVSRINTKDSNSWLILVSNVHLINHILQLFKLYIYKFQNKYRLNINYLLDNIIKIKELEKVTAFDNVKKVVAYNKKWDITNRKHSL